MCARWTQEIRYLTDSKYDLNDSLNVDSDVVAKSTALQYLSKSTSNISKIYLSKSKSI